MDSELLALLLAAKAQMEADAVELESTTRWCRPLEKLIEQQAMPASWERLVAYLRARAPEAIGPAPIVCGNCDTAVPPGCSGTFKDDGTACLLNRKADRAL